MKHATVLLMATGLACAQTPSAGQADLKSFLGLTEAQFQLITGKNIEFDDFAAEKYRRLRQVQAEIDEETRKETLDPMALGLRTREIELIRREIRAAEQRLRDELRTALTAGQISKLDELERTSGLLPVYREAVSVHLSLSQPVTAVPPATPGSVGQGVEGRITETGGRPVAGAMVVPKSLDEPSPPIPEIAIVSDGEGRYSWRLPAGTYEISVSAEGYGTAQKQAVVQAQRVTRLDFVLDRP